MVSTTMAIERETDDAPSIRDAIASEKRKEVSFLRAQGRSRGLLFLKDVQYRAAAIRAKARAKVLARRGRLYATIVKSLDM